MRHKIQFDIVNGRDLLTDQKHAELIVRAVNSHQALLDACKESLQHAKFGFTEEAKEYLVDQLLAAIALAEKES
jgi:hypothetical protein